MKPNQEDEKLFNFRLIQLLANEGGSKKQIGAGLKKKTHPQNMCLPEQKLCLKYVDLKTRLSNSLDAKAAYRHLDKVQST